MKTWEVNGNLKNDYMNLILYNITMVKQFFDNLFGVDLMSRYDLFVDNSTCDSSHTPMIIPVLKKYLIIKLHITTDSHAARVVYQFAHELTHFLYYCKYGIDKPFATKEEESICSAVSLICVNSFYPQMLNTCINSAMDSQNEGYIKGIALAQKYSFDINSIKSLIDSYRVIVLEEKDYNLEVQIQNP